MSHEGEMSQLKIRKEESMFRETRIWTLMKPSLVFQLLVQIPVLLNRKDEDDDA